MNHFKTLGPIAAILLASLCCGPIANAQPMTGSVNRDGWQIGWSLASSSGIRITSLFRNNVRFMAQGSMPAVRVDYDGRACGPFLDRIKWDNIKKDGSGNKLRVTVTTDFIRLWVVAKVESYNLEQSWWFSRAAGAGGQVFPELKSSGLQCQATHRHHPNWRFDFDAGTSGGNRSWSLKNGVFTQRNVEWNGTKEADGAEIIIAQITDLTRFINLRPGPNDGTAIPFANWDYGGRRFPASANDPYLLTDPGSLADQGDFEAANNSKTTNNGEVMDNADLEYWYVAHLQHALSVGSSQFLGAGPILDVTDNP